MVIAIMFAILIGMVAVLVVLGVVCNHSQVAKRDHIRLEARLAEHHLSQIAQAAFQAMLEEARRHQERQ